MGTYDFQFDTDNDGKALLQDVNVDSSPLPGSTQRAFLRATTYNSMFPLSHDTYNGIYAASDGKVYYVLCSESIEEGGKMYSFDPQTKEIVLCGDLTTICGEKGINAIPQGKSHVNFVEVEGKLFFGTHIGYYNTVDGVDKMGDPPAGYGKYPGGHLLSYDLKTKNFEDLGIVPHEEGVLTMNMDTQRKIIYGITWPSGYFFRLKLGEKEMTNLGPVSGKGEGGADQEYRTLCRSIAINPDNGSVYLSTSEGFILRVNSSNDDFEIIEEDNLRKDYFGVYNPSSPGHMGYNWRQVFWHPADKCVYGVHGNSGYFFRFTPQDNQVVVLDRITSKPSQMSGMFDQFSYGYLGLTLAADERTVYYLTGSPMFLNGKRVVGKSSTGKGEAKGLENLHLITYDIPSGKYIDHGPIYFKNGQVPLYVNSITIGSDGTIYFLGRITEEGKTRTDLISIRNPF